jgi:hypothetical protein
MRFKIGKTYYAVKNDRHTIYDVEVIDPKHVHMSGGGVIGVTAVVHFKKGQDYPTMRWQIDWKDFESIQEYSRYKYEHYDQIVDFARSFTQVKTNDMLQGV